MIEPAEASRLIADHLRCGSVMTVALDDAAGSVLAQDVATSLPLPPFDNSAMDGYAVVSGDTTNASAACPVRLTVEATVFAGHSVAARVRPGGARAIMTGAPMPDGADSVVPRERAVLERGRLIVSSPVTRGAHVRRRGEEVAPGTALLMRGQYLHAGAMAVLATAGRARARVYARPRVAVIATGNEARPPGARLRRGEIFDSNSTMVSTMVEEAGFEVTRRRRVRDHAMALQNALAAALGAGDVAVVTGGVSVGDHDYLRSVLKRLNVREVFWRVSQKPGKPLYFGTKGRRAVFGLPGNPASAFTCFHLYVLPALRRMAGVSNPGPAVRRRRTDAAIRRDPVRWWFLKARLSGDDGVTPLPAQGSHMTTSLAHTDALIAVAPGSSVIRAGARVDVYELPVKGVGSS